MLVKIVLCHINVIMMNKLLIIKLVLFVIVVTFVFMQCKNDKPQIEWETYDGESFMIDYPVNWDIDSTGQYNVQSFACMSPETGNYHETLSVGIALIIDSAELKTAVENFMNQWDSKKSKLKPIEIGNRQGFFVEANKDDIFFKNYFLKKEDTMYYIFYAGYDAAIRKWNDEGRKMVNSLRIVK